MISRRLLRIKALMALYAFNRREDVNLPHAEKELMFSIGKTYDLYHYLLLLVLEIADIASEKIDFSAAKLLFFRYSQRNFPKIGKDHKTQDFLFLA